MVDMVGSRFSPEIRRALRVDISATLLFTVFAGLTSPFIGLVLRAELGATPLQLAVPGIRGCWWRARSLTRWWGLASSWSG
jgi:hypothetical protein